MKSRIYVCGRLRYGHFERRRLRERSSQQFLSSAIFDEQQRGEVFPTMKFGCHDHYNWTIGSALPDSKKKEKADKVGAGLWNTGHWDVEHPLNCCTHNSDGSFYPPDIWSWTVMPLTLTQTTIHGVEARGSMQMSKQVPLTYQDCLTHIEQDAANGVVSL
ncbi:MAG: hypothetical protein ACYTEQ_15615 [Planctomycetota bacterium]